MLIGLLVVLAAWIFSQKRGLDWEQPQPRREDLPLATRVVGQSEKAIVLLHGLAGSGRYFGRGFDSLAESGWSVVVPDLAGFGRSRQKGELYDLDEHVSAIKMTLDALGVREIVIVGHSTGCVLALELARRIRTHAIVAIAPVLYDDPDQARKHLAAMGTLVRHFALQTPIARRTCHWMCRNRALAGWLAIVFRLDLPTPVARDGAQHTWKSYSQTLEKVVIESRSARLLDEVQVPVLLVAGDEDPAMARETLNQLAQKPNVELHILKGGHDLPLRRLGRCLETIRTVIPYESL